MATAHGPPSDGRNGAFADRESGAVVLDRATELDPRGVMLSSALLERGFRDATAASYRFQVKLGLAAISIPMLGFSYSDFYLFGTAPRFWWLLALRVAIVAAAALVVRTARVTTEPDVADRALLAWWIGMAVCLTTIDATRPPTYLLHVAIDVLFVITAYVLPSRWTYQVLSGALITVGPVVVFATCKTGLAPMQLVLVATSFVYANTLGVFFSRHMSIASRTEFVAHVRELEARTRLRDMSRLIPMCSSCKSIRDPAGAWHRVEEFVHAETGSDVTHGLCPSCVETLYPQLARKIGAHEADR